MNLSPRPQHTETEKHAFYESAAKRFKAELRLYGATAAIHIENKNDEVFWSKVLKEAWPDGKFRFISASRSIDGNVTCGCTQCLKYRDFLDNRLWIAIDSDYRYLTEEPNIDARHHILQTYTYSFENHFCYYKNCQRVTAIDSSFDWKAFLTQYSNIVYPLLVWQLYLQNIPDAFPKNVFHRLLSLPVGPRSLDNNGAAVLKVLKDRCKKLCNHLKRAFPDADYTWHEARCNAQGVHRDNCYLFVRGHQLYDLIAAQGHKINHKFEKELTKELCFGDYDEIKKIHEDIRSIKKNDQVIIPKDNLPAKPGDRPDQQDNQPA